MPPATVSRRTFVAGAAAGLAASATSPALSWGHGDHDHRRSQVPPKPILGGFQVPGGPLFRVFAPGPPDITLPFTQVALEGLDAETSTLTDFSGFAAVAFHVGTATDRDGVKYNLETDIRAYQGPYVDTAGTKRFGTFAFIWVDLFEPGSGLQRHDNNGGILASGLFWTLPVSDRAVRVSRDRRHATLEVHEQQVIDSFQFGGAFQTPARVSFRAEWRATGPAVPQGSGKAMPPEDKRAWLGEMAPALSTARIEGEEFGFAFHSDGAARTDRGGYAQLGRERNGVFL